ncbi:NAD(P)/FAD-dependent oxidoreductase [Yanshouia hominis]|uniref:FAD-dependent oxidoreductase n=1 Tax=Yanshouia hominis TaxID=2763673 RepID=A0ABR7NFU2_9FIRM|nr:NAD(P)/FAD-dependent oxidoreductase [Yanshouia hominis]MBC8575285.1 FAD-dependent oxidoreductase [Yanshouia hominis]
MKAVEKKIVIIGAGPAGLAAALRLYDRGERDIVLLEREREPGGILRQCIHDGFGLTRFGETLSGPEYAARFTERAVGLGLEIVTGATVIGLTSGRVVTAATREGLRVYRAQAVILAMGCRERTRGALSIPGRRPSGVFTAGVAQTYMNLKNTMVGREAVILGSGDIGMIMARRLTLEGAHVKAVFEIQPYPSGLPRNIEQCLNDYGIPLYLSHTVTQINGDSRLSSVVVSEVDVARRPIPGTEREIPCDTLILSVGLIPENELTRMAGVQIDPGTAGAVVDEHYQTSIPGIFSAGNVLHVHDLVDFVSLEAEALADSVLEFCSGSLRGCPIEVSGEGCGHVIPQTVSGKADVTVSFRPRRPMRGCIVSAVQDGKRIASKRLPRANPAEMERLSIPAAAFLSQSPIKVVLQDD